MKNKLMSFELTKKETKRALTEIKNNKFDICYLNYLINYNYKRPPKIRKEQESIINFLAIGREELNSLPQKEPLEGVPSSLKRK